VPDRSYIHESRESVRFGAMYRRSTSWRRDKYETEKFNIIVVTRNFQLYYIYIIYSHYINDVCICGGAFPCVKCVCQAELMDKKIASAKILSISRDIPSVRQAGREKCICQRERMRRRVAPQRTKSNPQDDSKEKVYMGKVYVLDQEHSERNEYNKRSNRKSLWAA